MIGVFLRAIRIHQWLKNLLIFAPLVLGHYWADNARVLAAVLAFLAFSLMASAFYIINDIVDIEADRAHPEKRKRPFAAGELRIGTGYVLFAILLAASLAVAVLIGHDFALILGAYAFTAVAYSNFLKKIELLDVAVLAGLYTLRIIAGAVAIDATISFWLAAFSIFIFFSLAMLKRFSELYGLQERDETRSIGRGYHTSDLNALSIMGVASGYCAVLIMALYINDPTVTRLYREPAMLWVICPAVLYWISSLWFSAQRGKMHEDPIVYALKDRTSYGIAVISVAGLWLAV